MFNADFFAILDRNFPTPRGFSELTSLAARAYEDTHRLEDDKRTEYNAIDEAIGQLDDAACKRYGGFDWPDDIQAEYTELNDKWYQAQAAYYNASEVANLFEDLIPALQEVTEILERLEQLRSKG